MNVITNPVKALVDVGKENSHLHEELAKVYAELDLYRNALTTISTIPHEAASRIAKAALAQQRTTG